MFTQRISMDCTKEQYEKYLKDELLKMGYKEDVSEHSSNKFIYNNFTGEVGVIGMGSFRSLMGYDRTYLGSFNAPLFLALAAMTDKPEGNYGEYWVCIKDNAWFTENNLYKSIGVYHDKSPKFYDNKGDENGAFINHLFKYFRKATKEELMAKFGENKTENGKEIAEKLCNDINRLQREVVNSYYIGQTINQTKELEAISLLKSKGYKILKPKTWEEV